MFFNITATFSGLNNSEIFSIVQIYIENTRVLSFQTTDPKTIQLTITFA